MPSERFASSGAALAHAVKAWLQLKVQQRVRVRLPRAHAAPLQLPALLPRPQRKPAPQAVLPIRWVYPPVVEAAVAHQHGVVCKASLDSSLTALSSD